MFILMMLTLLCEWILNLLNELLSNNNDIIDCVNLPSCRIYRNYKICVENDYIILFVFRPGSRGVSPYQETRIIYDVTLGQRSRRDGFESRQIRDRSPNWEEERSRRRRSRSFMSQKAELPDLRDVICGHKQQNIESIRSDPRVKLGHRTRDLSRDQNNQRFAEKKCEPRRHRSNSNRNDDNVKRKKEPFSETFRKLKYEKYNSQELEDAARSRMIKCRAEKSSSDQSFLIPQIGEAVWGDKKQISKFALLKKFVGYTPKMGKNEDQECMEYYLDNVMEDGLQDLRVGEWEKFLPLGAPLIDFLAVDLKEISGWKYPKLEAVEDYQKHRGLNRKLLKSVEVKEIVIGVTSDEVVSEIHQWMSDNYDKNQKIFPSGVISMDVEEAKLTRYDELRLLGVVPLGGDDRVAAKKLADHDQRLHVAPDEKDRWRQVPVRLMIGDGVKWVIHLVINLGWKDGNYLIRKQTVSNKVLDFIRSIPVCTGLGIRSDVLDIEEFYTQLSGQEVKMKGFLGLETLAVVAGYRLQSMAMTTMGVQIIGSILNKCSSTGDQKWGLRWNLIPDALKIYAIGDIRFGHITYQVIAGILLRDVFPDPEITCTLLACFQDEAVAWFGEIVLESLMNVEVDTVIQATAQTKDELLMSLKGRSPGGKLLHGIPEKARIWSQLYGSWPALTNGGARWLIEVRLHCLKQMSMIKESGIGWSGGMEIPVIGEYAKTYAGFGINVSSVDWSDPVPHGLLGLRRPTSISPKPLTFEPKLALGSFITKKCAVLGIGQKTGLREWAIMNPVMVSDFINRMMSDPIFSSRYADMYDPIRLSAWRCTDKEPPRIQVYEDELNEKGDAQLEHEFSELVKAQELAESRLKRWRRLRSSKEKGRAVMRARWKQQALPSLPAWKAKPKRSKNRNGIKRRKSPVSCSGKKKSRLVEPSITREISCQSKENPGPSVGKSVQRNMVILPEDDGVNWSPPSRSAGTLIPSSGGEIPLIEYDLDTDLELFAQYLE